MNGTNAFFRANPFLLAQQVPINLINMQPASQAGGAAAIRRAMGNMDLLKVGSFDLCTELVAGRQNMFLRPLLGGVVPTGDGAITAYWCPYKPPGTQGTTLGNVPHVDLPKANPVHDFMFTGAMNGCSLVILDLRGKIRVYHDSAHDAQTFANQQPILRVDYCPQYFNSPYYYFPNANNGGQAANFLYFDRSAAPPRWTVVVQPLRSAGAGDMQGRSPMDFHGGIAPFQVAVPY